MYKDEYTGEVKSHCPECWTWCWWDPEKGMCDDCYEADMMMFEHQERVSYLLHRAMQRVYKRQ